MYIVKFYRTSPFFISPWNYFKKNQKFFDIDFLLKIYVHFLVTFFFFFFIAMGDTGRRDDTLISSSSNRVLLFFSSTGKDVCWWQFFPHQINIAHVFFLHRKVNDSLCLQNKATISAFLYSIRPFFLFPIFDISL